MGGLGGLFDFVFDGFADDLRFGQVTGFGGLIQLASDFSRKPNADKASSGRVGFSFCFFHGWRCVNRI